MSSAFEPEKSVEGYVVMLTGISTEATLNDVKTAMEARGPINGFVCPIANETGLLRGYALVSYNEKEDADAAIEFFHGQEVFGMTVECGYAIAKDSKGTKRGAREQERSSPVKRRPQGDVDMDASGKVEIVVTNVKHVESDDEEEHSS
ncbi:hypothetical protein KIPB_001657 [Kipferlia bialata]|uniref:RRM domain-containing protein n=1 Tax=Kipferlia bialata TaxID=797122 RepID=A0A9K3CR96_9EUKA|nr:hypothetical protein KIPB_001657 [Kipferlia bialata]|eukprot:g1657.t1